MTLSIGIDGFNMAMPDGTGVATYGVALAAAVRALGHRADGVFGLPGAAEAALGEVLFFEALERGSPEPLRGWPAALRPLARRAGDVRPLRARAVPATGRVDRRPFADRLPAFDRLWTVPGLWGRAERHFRRTGRLLTLRLPDPPGVMHWTYPLPVRLAGAANLYTIHDLVPLRLPYATLDRKRAYRRLLAACAREARALVAVSESSRRDVLDWTGLSPDRVVNTGQALPATPPAVGAARVLGLEPGGYFLFYGALEPKKNVGRLLEAFLSSGASRPLVLVGARAWAAERELRLLGALEETGVRRVIRLDYLPRRLLLGLVREARALLFPSLHEGFGLPVLEAMGLGVPVVTSTGGALPEVAGGAALLLDPYDVTALAHAIARLDRDEPLRADLAARGPARAALFSADRYAERLAALYAQVAQ